MLIFLSGTGRPHSRPVALLIPVRCLLSLTLLPRSLIIFLILDVIIVISMRMSVVLSWVFLIFFGVLIDDHLVVSHFLQIGEVSSSAHLSANVLKWLIDHADDEADDLHPGQRHNYQGQVS